MQRNNVRTHPATMNEHHYMTMASQMPRALRMKSPSSQLALSASTSAFKALLRRASFKSLT
jgi:hypothetical protein